MSVFDVIMNDPDLRSLVVACRNTSRKPCSGRLSSRRPLTEIEVKLRQRGYARKSYWRKHPQVDESLFAPPLFE